VSTPPADYPDYFDRGYPPAQPPVYPPVGYPPAAYPAPAWTPQPYPPWEYGWQPNSAWQPGYGAAPPPRYGALSPGIVPLRPLSLSDIFNGAAVSIRRNPGVTLKLTAVVVVITQLITLAAAAGPLAAASRLRSAPTDELTGGDVAAWMLSAGLSGLVGWLAGILLTGMLTVVVGRAVFGNTIGVGEAWAWVRNRLPALLGLLALEAAGLFVLIGGVGAIIGATAAAGNIAAAVILGFPLVLTATAAIVYLYVALSFAPVLIVLERLPVIDSMTRSFNLVRNSFWRVLGIRMLTWLVVSLVAGAIAVPFDFLGHLAGGSGPPLIAATVGAIGAAVGRIITAPFSAGVVVLLYTDRRIRAEAFDLVLQTGAVRGPAGATPTDYLWLTRPVSG
jgi:hypothetical protein